MARYDIDKDGRISGQEWDFDRKKFILILENEKASSLPDQTGERANIYSENINGAGLATTDTTSEYGPIRVESLWGAIAMFCLCQLYYFILFCFGFYPFPSKQQQWWHTLLNYIFIWGLTVAAAKNLRGGIHSTQPLGLMNVIPGIMGFIFFTVSAFLGDVFYFAGTFAMGFALIPARPLLLCNQTNLLRNRKQG